MTRCRNCAKCEVQSCNVASKNLTLLGCNKIVKLAKAMNACVPAFLCSFHSPFLAGFNKRFYLQ